MLHDIRQIAAAEAPSATACCGHATARSPGLPWRRSPAQLQQHGAFLQISWSASHRSRPDMPAAARYRGLAAARHQPARGPAPGLRRRAHQRCIGHIRAHDGRLLWCHGRTSALPFYRALGFYAARRRVPDARHRPALCLRMRAIKMFQVDDSLWRQGTSCSHVVGFRAGRKTDNI